jgi:hypothetical protein
MGREPHLHSWTVENLMLIRLNASFPWQYLEGIRNFITKKIDYLKVGSKRRRVLLL